MFLHPRLEVQTCAGRRAEPLRLPALATAQSRTQTAEVPVESHSHSPPTLTSRRSILSSGTILLSLSIVGTAEAFERPSGERRGLARYVKKKQLDPLESYVPPVLAARKQLSKAGTTMKVDLQTARGMLRSGPFDGLRENVKALGEYAEQQGTKDSKKLVDRFFLAVQDFDFTLFQAKRYNKPVSDESNIALQNTIAALDKLLATVPSNIIQDSEKIVKAVEETAKKQPIVPKEGGDQQLDQLVQLVP